MDYVSKGIDIWYITLIQPYGICYYASQDGRNALIDGRDYNIEYPYLSSYVDYLELPILLFPTKESAQTYADTCINEGTGNVIVKNGGLLHSAWGESCINIEITRAIYKNKGYRDRVYKLYNSTDQINKKGG